MGGELVWTPVRTRSDDEREESWTTLNTAGSDEDPNNCWYYRPSDLHQLKGLAMRAGIQYLQSVQHQIDERGKSSAGSDRTVTVAGSRQFLSEAGIIAAARSPTDSRALDDASAVIPKAVALLRSWLREPVLGESGHPEPAFMSMTRLGPGLPLGMGMGNLNLGGLGLGGAHAGAAVRMEDMLNMNFLISEVYKHDCCPAALHRVGLGGLYYFAKLADNHQFIYPFEARVLAATLTRLLDFLPDTLDWKETAGKLRDLLHKCGEDEMTMIQG